MKLRGIIHGVITDPETGKVVDEFHGINHIQDSFLQAHADSLATPGSLGSKFIFLSELNTGYQSRNYPTTLSNCWAGRTDTGGGVVSPIIEENQSPGVHLVTFQSKFDSYGSDVDIRLVGLCNTSDTQKQNATGVSAVVWLASSCLWSTPNILTVYYKIQFFFDENWKTFLPTTRELNYIEQLRVAQQVGMNSGTFPLTNSGSISFNGLTNINLRKTAAFDSIRLANINLTGLTVVENYRSTYFWKSKRITIEATDGAGRLVGQVGAGAEMLFYKAVEATTNPLQGLFLHGALGDKPFYDVANIGSTLGEIDVNVDTWDKDQLAQYYEVVITTAGDVSGTPTLGKYQFRKRLSTGFTGNTFQNTHIILPYSSHHNAHYIPSHDVTEDKEFRIGRDHEDVAFNYLAVQMALPFRYKDNRTVIALWNDSFAVLDVYTGEGEGFHNSTKVGGDVSPFFAATSITQLAIASNNDFWISCENTGLYFFTAAPHTLTVITPPTGCTACQAVAIGNGVRVWAYWRDTTGSNSGLYYTDDGGTVWVNSTLPEATFSGFTGGHFSVKSLVVDVNNAAGELAIIYQPDSTVDNPEVRMKWWDHALTTVTEGPDVFTFQEQKTQDAAKRLSIKNHSYYNQDILKCSPNQSEWVFSRKTSQNQDPDFYKMASGFGSTGVDVFQISNTYFTEQNYWTFALDDAGLDAVYCPCIGASDIHFIVLLSLDGIGVEASDYGINKCLPDAYMGEGVWLCRDVSTVAAKTSDAQLNMWTLITPFPETRDKTAFPGLFKEAFPTYGWTGSAWAKGNAGEKDMHAAAEELLPGVTVAFDESNGDYDLDEKFSFGVYDGIWLDEATTFDYDYSIYLKPTKVETSIEDGGTIVTPRVRTLNQLETTLMTAAGIPLSDAVDITIDDPEAGLYNTSPGQQATAGGRSTNAVINASISSYLPNNVTLPEGILPDDTNVMGYVRFRIYADPSDAFKGTYGIVPFAKLGTALNEDDIDYSIRLDSSAGGGDAGDCRIFVIENGTERYQTPSSEIAFSVGATGLEVMLVLLDDGTNGSVVYLMKTIEDNVWVELWRTPDDTVPKIDYYFNFMQAADTSRGVRDLTFGSFGSFTANFYYLGNPGGEEGVFSQEFIAVDPYLAVVTLDGGAATDLGESYTGVMTTPGEYSIFPEGAIRLAESGETATTITVEYVTLTHE